MKIADFSFLIIVLECVETFMKNTLQRHPLGTPRPEHRAPALATPLPRAPQHTAPRPRLSRPSTQGTAGAGPSA